MNLDDLNLDEFDVSSLPHKDLPCKANDLNDLWQTAAIYFVRSGKNIVYIGQTCNLCRRIHSHKYTEFKNENVQFYYMVLSNWYGYKYSRIRMLLEKAFIEYFRPPMNTVFVPETSNVTNSGYLTWASCHQIDLSYQETP